MALGPNPLAAAARRLRQAALLAGAVAVAACALPSSPSTVNVQAATSAAAPRIVIFGEQHDQPDHQRQVALHAAQLAAGGKLGAVVLEMADRGRSTRGLSATADAAQVREALAWQGWPWEDYAEVVMTAVRAGVPVIGGNQPRPEMRASMADAALDAAIPPDARARLASAVRIGHCGLLPAEREPGMVRIQVARDLSMARTLEATLAAVAPGQQVLLLTGAQHAARDRGVPLHLPASLSAPDTLKVVLLGDAPPDLAADERRPAAFTPRPDPCEALRERLPAPPARPAAS